MMPGRMDRKITLQVHTESRSSSGAFIKAWADLAEVWAEVIEVSGRERFAADREIGTRAARFMIWYRPGLSVKAHRINYDGATWDIVGIKELGFREGIELTAEVIK